MRRREFAFLVASVAAGPSVAYAQRSGAPRVALLLSYSEGDADGLERARVFRESLVRSGPPNAQVELAWLGSDARAVVGAVVESRPNVIVVTGTPGLAAIRDSKTTIPASSLW